ncbi:hypothetical protein Bca52824_040583 [Brassica carinata]|uniref:Uncharacterized protein n=1 Tax=Brassica carinata TaxID=52824 RepID=A0A8X7RRI9_BRACI|nr:hypothetical protein Bca52824_040583 [Brassica carinata]
MLGARTASSFSQAHVFVSGGGAFIGLRLGVCHCDGLPDSFLCFLTALASSEWWCVVDSGGHVFIHSIMFYGGDGSSGKVVDITFPLSSGTYVLKVMLMDVIDYLRGLYFAVQICSTVA